MGTLLSTKIFIKNIFLFHTKCTFLANSLQKIKIKIKSEFLLYPMVPFLATFLVTIKYSPKNGTLYTIIHVTLPLRFS